MKLKIKANMNGAICLSASQNSVVLLISTVDGILISIINSVNVMANTPSQKASNRELGLVSAISHSGIDVFEFYNPVLLSNSSV